MANKQNSPFILNLQQKDQCPLMPYTYAWPLMPASHKKTSVPLCLALPALMPGPGFPSVPFRLPIAPQKLPVSPFGFLSASPFGFLTLEKTGTMTPTAAAQTKKELIIDAIAGAQNFRFCGPSDDPDEQTAVTLGFRHLVIQLKRLAGPSFPKLPHLD